MELRPNRLIAAGKGRRRQLAPTFSFCNGLWVACLVVSLVAPLVATSRAAADATDSTPRPKGRFGGQLTVLDQPIPIPDYIFQERMAGGDRTDRAMLEFRGRVVVLNFWATWCGVCKKEMPKLDALAGTIANSGVDIVALSIDDSIDKAGEALENRGHQNLRIFHDSQAVLSALLGIRGVPTTFVVGPDGNARAVVQGPADWGSPEAKAWLTELVPGQVAPAALKVEVPDSITHAAERLSLTP